MNVKPILTEKSLADAKTGKYAFWVPTELSKHQIKEVVGKLFGVHVVNVRTQSRAARIGSSLTRKKITIKARKKAIVSLKDKEKISLFEGDKK